MKLITEEIKKKLADYPLYSQDGKKRAAVVVAKFFLCQGAWTWYIMEGNLSEDTLYGIIINGEGEGEYGYINLQELQSLKVGPFGLAVERDTSFKPTMLKDIEDPYLKAFLINLYE